MVKSLLDVPRSECVELTVKQAQTLIRCLAAEKTPPAAFETESYFRTVLKLDTPQKLDANSSLTFPFNILERRMKYFTEKRVTEPLAVFIVVMCEGNPGRIIQMLYALHRSQDTPQLLTTADFVRLFPNGIPSAGATRANWDEQKSKVYGQDNLLDLTDTWK